MVKWIKENRYSIGLFALTAAGFVLMSVAQGCNIQSWIPFHPPSDVVQALDLPEGKLTLAEANKVWADWQYYVSSNTEALKVAVEDSNRTYDFIASLVNTGMGLIQGAAPSFPGGALLLSVLAGGGGLLLKRPGEDARVSAEKQASYNKGLETGKMLAEELLKQKSNPTT